MKDREQGPQNEKANKNKNDKKCLTEDRYDAHGRTHLAPHRTLHIPACSLQPRVLFVSQGPHLLLFLEDGPWATDLPVNEESQLCQGILSPRKPCALDDGCPHSRFPCRMRLKLSSLQLCLKSDPSLSQSLLLRNMTQGNNDSTTTKKA